MRAKTMSAACALAWSMWTGCAPEVESARSDVGSSEQALAFLPGGGGIGFVNTGASGLQVAASRHGVYAVNGGHTRRLYQWRDNQFVPMVYDSSGVSGGGQINGVGTMAVRDLPFIIAAKSGVPYPGGQPAALVRRTVNGVSGVYASAMGKPGDCVRKISGADWNSLYALGCKADERGNYQLYRIQNTLSNELVPVMAPFAGAPTGSLPPPPPPPGSDDPLKPFNPNDPGATDASIAMIGGIDIGVSDDGVLYLVGSDHSVWFKTSAATGFQRMPDVPGGGATRVAAASRGAVAVVANDQGANDNRGGTGLTGHSVYRLANGAWEAEDMRQVNPDGMAGIEHKIINLASDRFGRLWGCDDQDVVLDQPVRLFFGAEASHLDTYFIAIGYGVAPNSTTTFTFSDSKTPVTVAVAGNTNYAQVEHPCTPGQKVDVTVTDGESGLSAKGSATCLNKLPDHAPTVQVSTTGACTAPCSVTFTAHGNDVDPSDNDRLSYRWTGCASGTGPTIRCTASSATTLSATVTVTSNGKTASATGSAAVNNRPVDPGPGPGPSCGNSGQACCGGVSCVDGLACIAVVGGNACMLPPGPCNDAGELCCESPFVGGSPYCDNTYFPSLGCVNNSCQR